MLVFVLIAYMPFNILVQGLNPNSATGFNPINILLVLIVVAYVKTLITKRPALQIRSPVTLPLVMFLGLAVLSLLNGMSKTDETPLDVIIDLKQWITPMLLFFLVINCIDDLKDLKLLTTMIGVTTIAAGVLSIRDYLQLGFDPDKRIEGLMGQPNELGAFFAQYVFVFLGLLILGKEGIFKKLFYLVVIGVSIIAMLYTFSRGAYLAFAVTLIGFIFFKNRLLFIPLLLLLCVTVLLFLPSSVITRVNMTFEKNNDGVVLESSAHSRQVIWRGALEMIADYPIFGVGYAAFPYAVHNYIPEARDAHNMYLLIAGEMGLLGFAVFLWLLYRIIRSTVNAYKDTHSDVVRGLAYGYIFCFICMLIVNMFGSRFERAELTTSFWTLTALISWARINVKNKDSASKLLMGTL